MFSLGLEFSLRKLRAVGATALIAASLEILVMVFAGYQLGRLFGWGTMDSIFLGAILSISSTTIIIKALEELGKTKERFAGLIFGILIVEDILAIVMIALLSGFAATGALSPREVAVTVGKLGTFLTVLLVIGLILVPRLLNYVAKFKSDEMLLVMAVGLCFGVSLLATKLGYSVALGAFLVGAIVAEARQIHRIETLMLPCRISSAPCSLFPSGCSSTPSCCEVRAPHRGYLHRGDFREGGGVHIWDVRGWQRSGLVAQGRHGARANR